MCLCTRWWWWCLPLCAAVLFWSMLLLYSLLYCNDSIWITKQLTANYDAKIRLVSQSSHCDGWISYATSWQDDIPSVFNPNPLFSQMHRVCLCRSDFGMSRFVATGSNAATTKSDVGPLKAGSHLLVLDSCYSWQLLLIRYSVLYWIVTLCAIILSGW